MWLESRSQMASVGFLCSTIEEHLPQLGAKWETCCPVSTPHYLLPGSLLAAIPPDKSKSRCVLMIDQPSSSPPREKITVAPIASIFNQRFESVAETMREGSCCFLECLSRTAEKSAAIRKIFSTHSK